MGYKNMIRLIIRSVFAWVVSPVMIFVLGVTGLPMLFASKRGYEWERDYWLNYHNNYLNALRFRL